jgi:hypothetical protein
MRWNIQSLALIATFTMLLSACSNSGNLTLEPGAVQAQSQGSPFVQLNSGGQALIVEQGQTATTGVHGWVTLQPIGGGPATAGNGTIMTLNTTGLNK